MHCMCSPVSLQMCGLLCMCTYVCICTFALNILPCMHAFVCILTLFVCISPWLVPVLVQLRWSESRAVEHTWGRGSVGDRKSVCACVEMWGWDQRRGVRACICVCLQSHAAWAMFTSCAACVCVALQNVFAMYIYMCFLGIFVSVSGG